MFQSYQPDDVGHSMKKKKKLSRDSKCIVCVAVSNSNKCMLVVAVPNTVVLTKMTKN